MFWKLVGIFGISYALHEFWVQNHMKDLHHEIALITGGSEGIGRLMAKKIASLGSTVIIWARDEEKLKKIKEEIEKDGGKVFTYSVDVGDRDAVYSTAERVKKEVGDVTLLINNAGIARGRPILELKDEDIERTYKVNVLSHYWIIKCFLPKMLEKNYGHIVDVSSAGGIIGTPKFTDYSASKFAVFGMNESLRSELGKMGHASSTTRNEGIQVSCICPYFIDTKMFEGVKKNNVDLLLPILSEEYVAEKTIEMIKRGDGLVIVPQFPWLVFLMRLMLPTRWFDKMMFDIVGVGNTTDDLKLETSKQEDNFKNLTIQAKL